MEGLSGVSSLEEDNKNMKQVHKFGTQEQLGRDNSTISSGSSSGVDEHGTKESLCTEPSSLTSSSCDVSICSRVTVDSVVKAPKRKKMDEVINKRQVEKLPKEIGKTCDSYSEVDMVCQPSPCLVDIDVSETCVLPKDSTNATSPSSCANNYLAEPNYRFCNRRRRGSSLLLSPSTYDALSLGKTISFYNARDGSLMKIRVMSSSQSTLEVQDCDNTSFDVHSHSQEPIQELEHEALEQETSMGTPMESSDEQAYPMTVDPNDMSLNSCITETFVFSSKPKLRSRTDCFSLVSTGSKDRRRRSKISRKLNIPLHFSNKNCDCRFRLSSKRKCMLPLDSLDRRPYKKPAPFVSPGCRGVEFLCLGLASGVSSYAVSDAESCC